VSELKDYSKEVLYWQMATTPFGGGGKGPHSTKALTRGEGKSDCKRDGDDKAMLAQNPTGVLKET